LVSAISGFGNYGQARGFAETHALYEKLRSLQRLEATCRTLLEREKVGTVDPADEILRLELVDYDGKGIEPERLKQLIVIVRRLYMNLSRVHGIEGDRLRFKYFDSGSSLLIGIQGAKEVIQSMGTLLLQWWDKNRFARFDTFEKKMEAVSKSLTVMEEVKHSVEKNVINEETGRNLARRILVEVDQLVGIGATVPLDAAATVDQRELLLAKRDVKLLESGKPTDVEDDDSVS